MFFQETTLRNLSTGFLDTTETTVYSTVELKEPQFNRVFAEAAVLLDNKGDDQGDGVDQATAPGKIQRHYLAQ